MPVIAYNLLSSIEILTNGIRVFNQKCLKGIRADAERCKKLAETTLAIATALNPIIGYASAAEVSKEAYRTGKSVKAVTVEKGILEKLLADRLLDPMKLTGK